MAASSVWQVSDKPQGRKARAVLAGRYSLGTLWGFDGLVRSLRCRRELSEVIILLVVTVRGHTFDLCGPLIVDGLEPMMPWRLMVGKGSPLPTETGRFIGLLFMRIFSGLRMTGGALGAYPGSRISMTAMVPPQHGRARCGATVASSLSVPSSAFLFGFGMARSCRACRRLSARRELASKP